MKRQVPAGVVIAISAVIIIAARAFLPYPDPPDVPPPFQTEEHQP